MDDRSASRTTRAAITTVFALNGALFASIFARLPAIKDDLGLSEGQLGLALLCSMGGLLVTQPLAGALAARVGSRPLVLAGALGYALGLVPIALAGSFGALAAAFAFVGVANGVLDVSMNVQGLTIERALGRPILATLHAAFSFGALAGAGAGAAVAGAGIEVVPHLGAAAAAGALIALAATRLLMPASADATPEGPMFARPTRALAALGALAFCALLAEGAVNDWVAVYLDGELEAGEGLAAAGLAAFSLTMGLGRLAGDRLTLQMGPVAIARAGALVAATGMAIALVVTDPVPALAGFAAMGLGLATLFPLTLRAAAARSGSPGPAVAAVSATGYSGFLAGPPMIGGVAELSSLRTALVIVALLCAVAAVLSRAAAMPRAGRAAPAGKRPTPVATDELGA